MHLVLSIFTANIYARKEIFRSKLDFQELMLHLEFLIIMTFNSM